MAVREVLPLDDFGMQICRNCGQKLPLTEFPPNRAMRLGVLKQCRKCHSEQAMVWHDNNPDRVLDTQLKRKYGITLEQYNALLAEQGGVCAICGEPPTIYGTPGGRRRQGRQVRPRLVVDHDHVTGKVRGLLCVLCNRGIGLLKDSPDIVRFALKYLEEREGISGNALPAKPPSKLTEAEIDWVRSGYGGLTQKQAAAKLGVHPSVVSRIFTGARGR